MHFDLELGTVLRKGNLFINFLPLRGEEGVLLLRFAGEREARGERGA